MRRGWVGISGHDEFQMKMVTIWLWAHRAQHKKNQKKGGCWANQVIKLKWAIWFGFAKIKQGPTSKGSKFLKWLTKNMMN
jgi:hypothetical protein